LGDDSRTNAANVASGRSRLKSEQVSEGTCTNAGKRSWKGGYERTRPGVRTGKRPKLLSWRTRHREAIAKLPEHRNNHNYFLLIITYLKELRDNKQSREVVVAELTATPKEIRANRKEERIKTSPHVMFCAPDLPTDLIELMIRVFAQEKIKTIATAMIEVAKKLKDQKKSATTIYTYMRNVKLVIEYAIDVQVETPNVRGLMKELKAASAMATKKKAPVWDLEKAWEICAKLPKEARRPFKIALAAAARAGDLQEATHVSVAGGVWRIELPTTKTRGVTGRTIAAIPMEWIEKVQLRKWVEGLSRGEKLVERTGHLALLRSMKGRLNAMRRTAINLRLEAGHSPDQVREATLHTTNPALFNYVGR
jgi:hypothetical protein